MFAILETGGKQYKVQEGDVIYVEKLNVEEKETVTIETVIAIGDGKKMTMGKPYVKGATIDASVIKNGKADKIIVYKMKPKKNYRKKQGHRQPYTKVQINSIKIEK